MRTTHEDFADYVRAIADRLGLRDWVITTHGQAPNSTGVACTWLAYGQRVAEVWIAYRFHDDPPEEQRDTIVHELLHLHFAAMDGIVSDWLDEDKKKAYSRMFEHGIDAVARAVGSLMPLPGKTDAPKRKRAKPNGSKQTQPNAQA